MSVQPRKRRRRRSRKLKNTIVDIESIDIECGDNYINWIKLTKEKLKERESKLLMIRIYEIESNVNKHLTQEIQKYKISFEFIKSILNGNLFRIIDSWKGINISRLKKKLNKFKDYFLKSKNWWDTNKQKIIALSFWIPVFKNIQKV